MHNCVCIGKMSSTSAQSIVDENYSDENICADKTASECKVLSPQRSILKDSNVGNILDSSVTSGTVKVIVVIFNTLLYVYCLWHAHTQHVHSFYRASCALRSICHGRVSVCVSDCLSQIGVLLKWLNVG